MVEGLKSPQSSMAVQTQRHLSMNPTEGRSANGFFLFFHGTGAIYSRELSAVESSTKKARVQKGLDQHLELRAAKSSNRLQCFFKQKDNLTSLITTCPSIT